MKKILFIHHWGGLGGAGVSLLHIVKAVDVTAYEVCVYCPTVPPTMLDLLKSQGIRTIGASVSPPPLLHYMGSENSALGYRSIRNYANMAKGYRDIYDLVERTDPDIVAVNSMTLFWVGLIGKRLGKKTVCFHRETYAGGLVGARTRIIKYGLSRWFDGVAFISRYDMEATGAINGVSRVITDKVQLSRFPQFDRAEVRERLDMSGDNFYVLFVGGMSPLKGAHIAVDALREIPDSRIRLMFVLDGAKPTRRKSHSDCIGVREKLRYVLRRDYSASVIRRIDESSLWDRILFLPWTELVEQYYVAADAVIFPSTRPHQARPVYEAGAAGKAIVITDSDNIRESVKNEENGLTVPSGDLGALAQAISRLAQCESMRQEMGLRNFDRTRLNHNLRELPAEIAEFLSSI